MEIRGYQKGDETKILELFQLSFGKKMAEEYWEWRFSNNPFSEEYRIDLMWDGDQLVGHYAVSPIEMIVDKNVITTALSMTTMTHPNYGGKGIFSQLAESLYDKLSQDGFQMVWGFPNNNSHYGFNKNLNWKDIALQGMMSVEVKHFERSFIDNVAFDSVFKFTESESSILNATNKKIAINKTVNYLNWRYFQNPTATYKVLKLKEKNCIIVYKVITSFTDPNKNEIDVMDLNFNNDQLTLNELISSVLNNEENILKINLWDSLFSDNQIALEKAGFRIGAPVTYLGSRNLQGSSVGEENYKNWDISFSYSDVF